MAQNKQLKFTLKQQETHQNKNNQQTHKHQTRNLTKYNKTQNKPKSSTLSSHLITNQKHQVPASNQIKFNHKEYKITK